MSKFFVKTDVLLLKGVCENEEIKRRVTALGLATIIQQKTALYN